MNFDEYQPAAFKTSRIDWSTPHGRQVPILGVLGELGSVAAVLKKHERDGAAYTGYQQDLAEECGDVLWYLAAIATRYELKLDQILAEGKFSPPVGGVNGHLWSLIHSVLLINSILAVDEEFHVVSPGDLEDPLGETVYFLVNAIQKEGLTLSSILETNLAKTREIFGLVGGPAPKRDIGLEEYEQLPREGTIEFLQRFRSSGTPEVLLRMRGLSIGDRLTDNSPDPDGYRFHDALHLSYVAVLGWSPVIRALMHLKRKSKSTLDEQQDGARAIVIEEAITHQIFNYARDHSYFRGTNQVDPDLLKWIRKMVRGLEVAECTHTEWQTAILEGYKVFNALKEHQGGYVTIDADRRSLTFALQRPLTS
jgi:NTP pyrophosphatase (non-canonical NTP hydrolase)